MTAGDTQIRSARDGAPAPRDGAPATPDGAPSPLDAVRRLAPSIRQHADQIERDRELPRPLFEALADAGLFHLLVPRALGGAELDLPSYVPVIEELAMADASTAWCINQGGVFATYSACVAPDVARLIWVDTPRSVVANTPMPESTAVPVPGGYRVTGYQGFSTGCRHAAWMAPRGRVVVDGQPRRLPDGQPDIRYFLMPVEQVQIHDTWHVAGLRGTGTHHFSVTDVFVPEERTFSPDAMAEPPCDPLYVVPRTLLFATGDAAAALGVARSSVDAFVALVGAGDGAGPAEAPADLREQPGVHLDVGQAEARLRAARALLVETVRDVWDGICAAGTMSDPQRAALRLATTHALQEAAQIVDVVYLRAGPAAILEGHPLRRLFLDAHVITQHFQARLGHYELVGRYYLGLEADLQQL